MTQNTVKPDVTAFYDDYTNTLSYVVKDPLSKACAVIDSVLNYEPHSGTVSHEGAEDIVAFIKLHDLEVEWLIETHVHADHISAAPYIQERVGGKIAIGEHIDVVQRTFGEIFNAEAGFARDGSQFDHLFKDDEVYAIGNLECRAIHTPGHTPACVTHLIGDSAFVGDTIFMPDGGTARADFPGGNAHTLYESIQQILNLPGNTRIFVCHDYPPDDRELAYQTTVDDQRTHNIHVNEQVKENDFVSMRETRDKTLDMPRLILPSIQVNMRAGHFPEPESNNMVYLKIPINAFK